MACSDIKGFLNTVLNYADTAGASVVYSNIKFELNKHNHFIVTHQPSDTQVILDFNENSSYNISNFGLTVDDFMEVKVSSDGYKQILKANNGELYELCLTADGEIYAVHDGLPSLLGQPSKHIQYTGPTIDDKGKLKIPRVTAFSKGEFKSFINLVGRRSFNTVETHGDLNQTLNRIIYLNEGLVVKVPNFFGISKRDYKYFDKFPSFYMDEINLDDGTHWVMQ